MDIQESWKKHPLYVGGKVELVPTEWVWRYYGPDVSPMTRLKDGTEIDLFGLWQNIIAERLHDPLIMRVGVKNKMMRLEAGNHRIQLFHQDGVPLIPVAVQVREECGPHLGDVMTDASHNFDAAGELLISTIIEEYQKPSEVFRSLQNHT